MTARLPTCRIADRRAERVVLCGCLREPGLVLPRLDELGFTEADFTTHRHRLVWRAVLELAGTGDGVVGPYSLWALLRGRGVLAELGACPAAWIAGTWDCDPTGAWAVPEAVRLRWLTVRRDAVHAAAALARDAADGHLTPADPRLALVGTGRGL